MLVIDAANPVGRAAVEALTRAGIPSRVVRPDAAPVPEPVPGPAPGSEMPGTESPSHLDLADRRTWRQPLEDVERILLTWSPTGHDASTRLTEFLQRAVEQGVSRIVCVSPAGAGTRAPYHRMEEIVESAGAPCVLLRISPCFQILSEAFAPPVAEHDQLRLPVGRGRIAMVDARDVAEVAIGALVDRSDAADAVVASLPPRTVHTLSGEESLTGEEIAAILSRSLDRAIEFRAVSFRQYRRTLVASGQPLADVHTHLLENAASRLSLAGHTSPALRELLGHAPRTLAAYVRSHRHDWDRPTAS